MRAIGATSARRAAWLLASTSSVALVFSSHAAFSSCTFNSNIPPDSHVEALFGDNCSALGVYSTTTSGLNAGLASSGGVIAGTNGEGAVSFSTTAAGTPAVQADTGGSVNLNPIPSPGDVATSGAGSPGLFVTDEGSTITASGLVVATGGADAVGVLATNGGIASFSGGSITTLGASAPAVLAQSGEGGGGGVTLSGGTTILTIGDGSIGLAVSGSGSSLTATGTSTLDGVGVKTLGAAAFGASNGYGPGLSSGGTMNLTNAAIVTFGQDAHAVVVNGPGSQTNLGDGNSLNTIGDGAIGLYATGGGVVTATGGVVTISTSGTNSEATGFSAFGVYAEGSGSQVDLAGATITTTGQGAVGLYASLGDSESGGTIIVSGPLSVATGTAPFASPPFAYGAWAQGPGSTIALNGPSTFTINGGAYALYATQGGAISTSDMLGISVNSDNAGGVEVNDAGSSATLKGATTIALNGSADAALFAAAGGAISVEGPATINVSGANSVGVEAFSSVITASGPLNITTAQISSPAFALSGASPIIAATGGGTVSTAGNAIEFINAMNAVATFDNFTIGNQSGDLIFADPSIATINFNATVANAGTNNLLDAAAGSIVTLNANASALTGAIFTDATSTSNVNLTNGATWNMTGPSTVSNLSVFNSAVVFAPPGAGGAFKTLTVGAYVGSGANVTLNAFLSGSNSNSDRIIVNGGTASGSTLLTICNVGGLGGQTTGAGIPIVVTTNGGTIASNAFALANVPVVGGYRYTLDESAQAYYLVSSPTSTISDIANSLNNLARSQQSQIITNRILTSILLGATEQINCSNCSSGFGAIGSFALGAHGRWSLSDRLTVMGGFSYNQYSADGVTVDNAPMFAGSLVYDLVDWGRSRPFFEIGGGVTPYEQVHYNRYYPNGLTTGLGAASAIDRNAAIFGRVGWVDRLTPIDEAAVYGDLSRNWMQTGGYTEATGPLNPYPATVQNGVDTLNVARIGAQYTHLFAGNFEVNVSGALAYGFGAGLGSQVNVFDFGTVAPYPIENSGWFEYGARIGYRVSRRMVIDAFAVGTLGGQPAGNTIHGGLGLRYLF